MELAPVPARGFRLRTNGRNDAERVTGTKFTMALMIIPD
jgi:hypothetical protein